MEEPKIVSIVLTGGPCGGKSTVLELARSEALLLGWDVYLIQEPGTLLFQQGMQLKQALAVGDLEKVLSYECEIGRLSLESQARAERFAHIEGKRSLILLDRGVPDNRVYFPAGKTGENPYSRMLSSLDFVHPGEMLANYSAVIKLTTAADGAEPFYSTENNEARTETPHQARKLDQWISWVYCKHPQFHVIDNSTDFERKVRRALDVVLKILAEA